MGIQTITGTVKDTNGDPWANRVVEAAFSDGYVPLSPLNAFARTDTAGKFQLKVDNNALVTKAAILRLPDDSLFGFDLDPEDATVDLGDLVASGVEGAARLLPVPDGIRVYRALLTQANAAAPVATVFENTLGGTVVWSRSSAGLYLGTLADAFVENKTVVSHNTPMKGPVLSVTWAGAEAIQIETAEISIDFGNEEIQWSSADNLFGFGLFVQVLVYP